MESRAEIEARRGIERDSSGHIIRSKEWLKGRIKTLNAKLSILDQRSENIKVEIEERTAELKNAK